MKVAAVLSTPLTDTRPTIGPSTIESPSVPIGRSEGLQMLNPLLVATAQAFENLFDEEVDVVFEGYLARDRALCNTAIVTVRRSRRKPGQRRDDLLVLSIVADNRTRFYKDSAFSPSLFFITSFTIFLSSRQQPSEEFCWHSSSQALHDSPVSS